MKKHFKKELYLQAHQLILADQFIEGVSKTFEACQLVFDKNTSYLQSNTIAELHQAPFRDNEEALSLISQLNSIKVEIEEE